MPTRTEVEAKVILLRVRLTSLRDWPLVFVECPFHNRGGWGVTGFGRRLQTSSTFRHFRDHAPHEAVMEIGAIPPSRLHVMDRPVKTCSSAMTFAARTRTNHTPQSENLSFQRKLRARNFELSITALPRSLTHCASRLPVNCVTLLCYFVHRKTARHARRRKCECSDDIQ